MEPWWRGAVIYRIYPRSFRDTSGDGIGDLPGIVEKLVHVAGLGVDAPWLCPIHASPGADLGYDVSDHMAVAPDYGTLADLDALVAACHAAGAAPAARSGGEPHQRGASLVPGVPRVPQRAARGALCLGRSQAGWHAAEQLAGGVRRAGLAMGAAPAAIRAAPSPAGAARAEPR